MSGGSQNRIAISGFAVLTVPIASCDPYLNVINDTQIRKPGTIAVGPVGVLHFGSVGHSVDPRPRRDGASTESVSLNVAREKQFVDIPELRLGPIARRVNNPVLARAREGSSWSENDPRNSSNRYQGDNGK